MTGTLCLIALGSNIGERESHLAAAIAAMRAIDGLTLTAASRLYETAPVGGPDGQAAYLNAVVAGRAAATLGPTALLASLHAIEAARDRAREVHWGPRTLDLDLLVYGGQISDDPELMLPHPRMHERRFVMEPACDVAADFIHPRMGRSFADLMAALPVEDGAIAAVAETWAEGLAPVQAVTAADLATTGLPDSGLTETTR